VLLGKTWILLDNIGQYAELCLTNYFKIFCQHYSRILVNWRFNPELLLIRAAKLNLNLKRTNFDVFKTAFFILVNDARLATFTLFKGILLHLNCRQTTSPKS